MLFPGSYREPGFAGNWVKMLFFSLIEEPEKILDFANLLDYESTAFQPGLF
jgi:hypothetical protein